MGKHFFYFIVLDGFKEVYLMQHSWRKKLRGAIIFSLLSCVAVPVQGAELTEAIKDAVILQEDTTVQASKVLQGNGISNKKIIGLFAEESTSKQKPMVIDLNGHNLTVGIKATKELSGSGQVGASIYVGPNRHIDIKNSNDSKGLVLKGETEFTQGIHGVYLDGNSHLRIQGPLTIESLSGGSNSARGISFSSTNSDMEVQGDVTIKSINVTGRRANERTVSAISLTGEDTSLNIKGNLYLSEINGTGIDLVGTRSKVNALGATILMPRSEDLSKAFDAIHITKGEVNLNVAKEGGNYSPLKNKVLIHGDVFVGGQEGKKVQEYTGGQLVDWKASGDLRMALIGKASSWVGISKYTDEKYVYGSDGSGGYTVSLKGGFELWLQEGATWLNKQQSLADKSWSGSSVSHFHGGEDLTKAGTILQEDEKDLVISSYAGVTKVVYDHKEDGTDSTHYVAGNTRIIGATENAKIIVATHNKNIDMNNKDNIRKTLNALGGKLFYDNYKKGERLLTAKAQIEEGLTASGASAFFRAAPQGDREISADLIFDSNTGQGGVAPDTAINDSGQGGSIPDNPGTGGSDDPIVYGDYETGAMKGLRTASTMGVLAWRDMIDDFTRLEDIRRGAETGPWVRVQGGSTSFEGAQTSSDGRFWGMDIGYDCQQDSTTFGGAFSYKKGSHDLIYKGEADFTAYSGSLYMNKELANDSYLSFVARLGQVKNDITAYNENGLKIEGDYRSFAYGLSAQVGKQIPKGDFYVEPQLRLDWSHVNSVDYTATAAGENMQVKQKDFNSLVGRMAIEVGIQKEASNLYARIGLGHEFLGDVEGSYTAKDGGTKATSFSLKDTWTEATIGGSYACSDSLQLFADISKTLNGDYKQDWKAKVELKYLF